MANKAQALKALKDSGNKSTIDLVCDLIIAMRDEAREANDNAGVNEFQVNQGKVQLAKEFLLLVKE